MHLLLMLCFYSPGMIRKNEYNKKGNEIGDRYREAAAAMCAAVFGKSASHDFDVGSIHFVISLFIHFSIS